MNRSHFIWLIATPVAMVLITSGCATKKYVRQQVAPVNQSVASLQKHTDDKISYLNNKQERDISQVNERIATTDQQVSQLSGAVQQAQGTASRAMDATEALGTSVNNALNLQLVQKNDVMFGFNKATLTPTAKTVLDQVASKYQSLPRGVVELYGFTDMIGSKNYNLSLSRKRAEAVQRYLVMQKVPVRAITIVGLGEAPPPPGLEASLSATTSNPTKAQRRRLERRVQISLYGGGEISQGAGSPSDQ